ncbi:MAG: RloB domain-containing protein [Chlorobium sp.]|nr:MAG: RloB domain-containing protein [Chlorobium sp.]
MGRDNHPRARQFKRDLQRKKALTGSYDRILIVTEGEKTGPLYFQEIKHTYKLHTANVQIMQSGYGTTPQQVVDFAYNYCKETKEWEQVFCVFDRDDHPNYLNAIHSAISKDKKLRNDNNEAIRFIAITSIPCFELWFLLHFMPVTSYIHRDDVARKLKAKGRIPGYEKGATGCFELSKGKLESAYSNADRLKVNAPLTSKNTENPFTNAGYLVKCLTTLKHH